MTEPIELAIDLESHPDMEKGLWAALLKIPGFDEMTVGDLRQMPDAKLLGAKGIGQPRLEKLRSILVGESVQVDLGPRCDMCKWFVGNAVRGNCRLNPLQVGVPVDHWCSHFERRPTDERQTQGQTQGQRQGQTATQA